MRPHKLVTLVALLALPCAAAAQTQPGLALASLEDLMNVEITLAGRTEQRVEDAAAAVFVLTQDDIRRSGMTTLPELFRLVPGMQVAKINGTKWAVSARGFNDLFSNKLLVLIDGRPIYNRAFSGVFWEDQDLPIVDIDRIEVVRGPGASMWGTNAMNGVINIITKSAADTLGPSVLVGGGSYDRSQALARYGGKVGSAAYRVYTQWSDHEGSRLPADEPANDVWDALIGGGRLDWTRGSDTVMAQAGFTAASTFTLWSRLKDPTPFAPKQIGVDSTTRKMFAQGRWRHAFAGRGAVQAQGSFDISRRRDGGIEDDEKTLDVDVQYEATAGPRNTLVVGTEIRDGRSTQNGVFSFSVSQPYTRSNGVGLFAQDRIQVSKHVTVIAGSKVERDSNTGWNVQPTLRGLWEGGAHRVWAAASRAVRLPSKGDRSRRLNVAAVANGTTPVLITLFGNPAYQPEDLVLGEAGYRVEVTRALSLDVAAYRGRYHRLPTYEPLAPVFEPTPAPAHLLVASRLQNLLSADTTGVEISSHWVPHRSWRLDGSYTGGRITPTPDPSSRDAAAAAYDGNAPAHQWQLHSSTWIGRNLEVNGGLFYTGRLKQLDVDSYLRADARLSVGLSRSLSLIVTGQNLFSDAHQEYVASGMLSTLVPRSTHIQLRWGL